MPRLPVLIAAVLALAPAAAETPPDPSQLVDPASCDDEALWIPVVVDVFKHLDAAIAAGKIPAPALDAFSLRFVVMQNELIEKNTWSALCHETLAFRLDHGF
jgi:hypothetical protein